MALAVALGVAAWIAGHYAMVFGLESAFATGPLSPINAEYPSSAWLDPAIVAEIDRRQLTLKERMNAYSLICRVLQIIAALGATALLGAGVAGYFGRGPMPRMSD